MDPLNSAVLTGAVVTGGKWAKGDKLSIDTVVGAGALAIGLSLMNSSAPELASKFATLILVVALFMYGPALAWRAGLIDHKKYPKAPSWGGAIK
jgi:hypothetical protein